MAIWDRLNRRRRPEETAQPAQRSLLAGWQENPTRSQADRKQMAPAAAEDPGVLDMMTQQPTVEQAEAYQTGQQMGIRAVMDAAGITQSRREQMQRDSRIMSPTRLNEATVTLLDYQAKKQSVNKRVVSAQQWWKLKNWQEIEAKRGTKGANANKSNTGWLWNCIVGKHADMMDNYPEPIFLPREETDKPLAKQLSEVTPVVMEMNDFEQVYSDILWQLLIEGTGVYGVFWNGTKLNGLGDIDIKKVNILNLYWEPGVSDIQDSRNVFYIAYEDKDLLLAQYPQLEGQLETGGLKRDQYKTDDSTNIENKAAVIDWYYKKRDESGRTILHYCKYVNEICLFSSEEEMQNNPEQYANGYYEDGLYPFVLDALYPVEGSPAGYGYVDIGKDTQSDIDTISQAMVLNAAMKATPRYFERMGAGINEDEFMDTTKMIIHVQGGVGTDVLRAWEVPTMGGDVHNMLQQKIDELKFITGNTDVNNGGVPAGVTAASAIAALKEDSGRTSKDTSRSNYRSFRKVVAMVLSRMTQFYDVQRQYRIIGDDGGEEFVSFGNAGLQTQPVQTFPGMEPAYRKPEFDIEIRAQRENAYTKMSQNELALQFWSNGMLNPQMTDQALIALDMMDFRDKDKLVQQVKAQGTMMDVLSQISQIALQLAQESGRPEIAQQLAMVMQGLGQDIGLNIAAPAGGGAPKALGGGADALDKPADPNENAIVARARERAASADRLD